MLNSKYQVSDIKGFNNVVSHIKLSGIISRYLSLGCNFADIIRALSNKFSQEQVPYFLQTFLVEKFKYGYSSINLDRRMTDFTRLLKYLKDCNQFNTTITYFHSQFGVVCLNPQSNSGWENLELEQDALVTIYTTTNKKLEGEVTNYLEAIKSLLRGEKDPNKNKEYSDSVSIIKSLKAAKAEIEARKRALAEKASQVKTAQQGENGAQESQETPAENKEEKPLEVKKKKKITPRYSVQVTNELFHNGNVEAWKNIIESYTHTYPEIEVMVFHQKQRIHNINTLFKWGKVKHGDVIFFCLAGDDFKSISKLQRYLFEGASNRFSRYLKKDFNRPLTLF